MKQVLKPAIWAFYLVIVFEILFMISPFALYFYSAYGPMLNVLHRWPETAWLTKFFLPHFSQTDSLWLNALPMLAWCLISVGLLLFLGAAVPLYWAKFRGRGTVSHGLYAVIRHPQYVGLAVMGLGTTLIWPRFLVLVAYVTMLCLYAVLARWEEERCLAHYGESYRAYQARTGMFLPPHLSKSLPGTRPASGGQRGAAALGLYAALLAASVDLAFGVRDYSLSTISGLCTQDVAVLSPALLTESDMNTAYRAAVADIRVQDALRAIGPAKLLVYVVPIEWDLADLPMETSHRSGGHYTPADFDRRHYKLLFTRIRTYIPEVTGRDIVKAAYGRDPILLVKVDSAKAEVTGIDTPPPHVVWGDISTPMF